MTDPGPTNVAWADGQIVHGSDLNAWDTAINALETLCLPLVTASPVPAATTLAEWDANKNLSANSMQEGLTVVATTGGTTIVTIASTDVFVFTGATTQTVTLPSTAPAGTDFTFVNLSTGVITINASGGATVVTLSGYGTGVAPSAIVIAVTANPTVPATQASPVGWACQDLSIDITNGKILHVSNTLTLAGTDGTTLTYGLQSGLADVEQFCTLVSAYTFPTSITTPQQLFNSSSTGAVTLVAGTYFFETLFSLSALNTGTSSVFGFALGGTAVLTSQFWQSLAGSTALVTPTINPQSTVNRAANTALVAANTTGIGWAYIYGKIRVGTGGTLIPQATLNTAAQAIVGADSYFRIWNVGASGATTFGAWS
jgi:hypothetical protein